MNKDDQWLINQYFDEEGLVKAKEILQANGNTEPYLTNRILHLCWIMQPMLEKQPRDKAGKFLRKASDGR